MSIFIPETKYGGKFLNAQSHVKKISTMSCLMHLQENSQLSYVLKDVQPQVCRRSKQTPILRAVINNCSKYHLPSPVTLAALGDDCPTVLLSVPTWGGLELSNACDPDMQVTYLVFLRVHRK